MVAPAVPTLATPATTGRVSAHKPRHGRHAATARAQRATPADQLRELRKAADTAPRAHYSSLPRWHKRDHTCEGWRNPKTGQYEACPLHSITSGQYAEIGRSWIGRYDPKTKRRELVREGTTSRVTWLSRDRYLTCFLPALLALAESRDVLRAHRVSVDQVRAWARVETAYAGDQATGRRVIVRPVTVADLMETSVSTVHRCRAAARELGIYATVDPGRMLSEPEQRHARWDHHSPQRGMASESAFVIPKKHAGLGSVTCLHSGAAHGEFSINPDAGLTVKTEGEKERTSSARTKKRRRRASPAWVLAKAVTERLSWAREADPKDLLRVLSRFATGALCWTADDVVRHIDAMNRRRGWTAIHSPADLKAPPGAMLAFYLRDADRDNDHPRLDLFAEREQAAATKADNLRARELHDRGERCGRDWCC